MKSELSSITVGEFKEIVKIEFKNNIKRPIFGLGKGGIGKTESIAQLACEELKIGFVDLRLLLYSEVDLKGIPFVNELHIGTIWLENDILPRENRDGKEGILLLDEVSSCSVTVRTAAYQLLSERGLGEYRLPEGWLVVCLGNGEGEGGDFVGIEGNFANRCCIFQVEPGLEEWKVWALEKNVHPYVIDYVTWSKNDLHSFREEMEGFTFASPRSWKAVSDILYLFGYDEGDSLTNAEIYANIGSVVGRKFLAFCKIQKNGGEIKKILDGDFSTKKKSQEDLLMLIQGVILQMRKEMRKNEVYLPILEEKMLESVVNGVKWMMSLEKVEHKILAMKDFISKSDEGAKYLLFREEFRLRCPELLEFVTEHREIFVGEW